MSRLTVEEKIQCLKNLLADPDDWLSAEMLRLSDDEETETPSEAVGINLWSPEANRSKTKYI